jgi:hypothetical protein
MHIICNFDAFVQKYLGQRMLAWLPINLPFPAAALVILQVHYASFMVIPIINYSHLYKVWITYCNLDNFKIFANQVQFLDNTR